MDNPVSELIFFVNGKKIVETNPDPAWTIIYYLREKLKLTGTKLACAEGGCGTCTVTISKLNRMTKKITHYSINTCMLSVCALHGLAVTTCEGIGNMNKLHPAQERIAKAHGSQCGFCTPGIVMSMYSLLRANQSPTMCDIDTALQGNLCRCTGYRPIIEAFRTFAEDSPAGDSSCGAQSDKGQVKLFDPKKFVKYNPAQELIFPPELRCLCDLDKQFLLFQGKEIQWYRPVNLDQLMALKEKYPDAKLVVGSTEIGIEMKFKRINYPVLIHVNNIPELKEITSSCCVVRVGAAVTLNELKANLEKEIATKKPYKTRLFKAIVEMLHRFGGDQVRNVACLAGNIINSSPISDLNPIFLAANCILEVNSNSKGLRKVKIDSNFFTGYKKNILAQDDVIIAINIPYTLNDQYFYAYKQSKRRDDDMATVNAAFNITLTENKISDIKLAFGGMAPKTVSAPSTECALLGEKWGEKILNIAYQKLIDDLPLSQTATGGVVQYRKALALSFFYKTYLSISNELGIEIPPIYKSAIENFQYETPKSSQYFEVVKNESCKDLVGRPVVHASAFKQTCGDAVFTDDIPHYDKELYAGLVLSTHTYAQIVKIDASKALEMEGVHGFFSAEDICLDKNKYGPVVQDEDIFASKEVTCNGQLIAIVVADNQLIAQRAARKVDVEYRVIHPPIITIEDAISKKSFHVVHKIENDCVDKIMDSSDHKLQGEVRIGAQEHFYFEPFSVIVVPKIEDNEMEIIASTQNPSEVANMVAAMLGIPSNRVVCKVKRCGGGFGGKESRTALLALPIAFAANKLKRPIRCVLDRDEDMLLTGKRHPFLIQFKVGFTKCGIINGLDLRLYSNAGNSKDLSAEVMVRAMLHSQNAYKIPALRVYGYVCKTNLASNTACRGFGCPQAMYGIETIIRRMADFLDKDVVQISEMNLQKEDDVTHYNQKITYCTLQKCWDECLEKANYVSLKNQVEEFNSKNRWKKRGLAIVPVMHGIAFTTAFLNQAGALVHVYTDGSVLISHGGVEMGQGLHTKMIQIASRTLGVPIQDIYICDTSTDKVPNTVTTAASSGSDLNGMAVKNACELIMERIKPFKEKNESGTFKDWALEAFLNCSSLSATGFYNICSELSYNIKTNTGLPFNYYTFGVACSVVEIDCLTGDHKVLKTDIVMDLGESLNPAIDIGQIEGAFIQGYGLYTMEEVLYAPTGMLWTRGPSNYKIPGFSDIPLEFNVSLLKGAPNPRAIYSSKAVGEPPLFLSSSVIFAIREAIKSARKDACCKEPLQLSAPFTSAKIRMACTDDIIKVLECALKAGPDMPWSIEV